MRFHLGGIPDSPDFDPGAEWKALKEPTPWVFQLLAVPVAILLAIGFVISWVMVFRTQAPVIEPISFIFRWHLLTGLLALIPLVIVHELIHMSVHPGAGRLEKSVLGFWPSRGICYAHFDGELSRERFVMILLMPLMIISVLPLGIAMTLPVHPLIAWLSFWNATFACGDVLATVMVVTQIPARAMIRNKGWRTYWREAALRA